MDSPGMLIELLALDHAKIVEFYTNVFGWRDEGHEGFAFVTYYGVLAPAGTPAAVVKELNEALVEVLARPDVKKAFAGHGLEAASSTPEEFASLIRDDIAKAQAIIESAKIKVQ